MFIKAFSKFLSVVFPTWLAPEVAASVKAQKGDITQYTGDAIVNAANSQLMAGGGVCGAIFNASDFDLLQKACQQIGSCPTGQARATPSFGMHAPFIIHAVGPIWRGGEHEEASLLAGAYTSAMDEARRVGAKSIAFPALSTGIYGYPLEEATRIAVGTISKYVQEHKSSFVAVDFVCFDDKTLDLYNRILIENANDKVPDYAPSF